MSETSTPPRPHEKARKAGSIGDNLKALRGERQLTIAQMAPGIRHIRRQHLADRERQAFAHL